VQDKSEAFICGEAKRPGWRNSCIRGQVRRCVSERNIHDQTLMIADYRHDFYQTPTNVIASLFLKNINKERAVVNFSSKTTVTLDLPTTDNKRYKTEIPLYGSIDTAESKYKIMGTKLELTLFKSEGQSWPTLRSDEQRTSEIIQVGRAGTA